MRDIHRNPMLYYIAIPLLVGLWPLLVWAVYLPAAKQNCQTDYSLLIEGQTHIMGILEIDPDRIKPVDSNNVVGEFVYSKAVDSMTNLCRIPKYKTSAGKLITISGKQRRDGTVKLMSVSIVQAAEFLSRIQATYTNLQCDKASLTKLKGMPDQWDVDFDFVYYY